MIPSVQMSTSKTCRKDTLGCGKQQTQTSKSMKLAFTALCAVAACLLAPAGTMFNGGPAPNELVIEEEKVVKDVALSALYTSYLCMEEQSAIGVISLALGHRDTADPKARIAPVFAKTGTDDHSVFIKSGPDTADPADRCHVIAKIATPVHLDTDDPQVYDVLAS